MAKILNKLRRYFSSELRKREEINSILLGKLLTEKILQKKKIQSLSEVEFKVFSEWGEDGIIQYLINNIPIQNKTFLEFGVENYTEANTRFLLINNNWRGVVIDGSAENIAYIRKDEIYWRYDLNAIHSFITRENINEIISKTGLKGDIGIMSIDIDGNDYWVWEAINAINPRIVICEYRSIFGNKHPITIPYQPDFQRAKAHFSYLYYGTSLPALYFLAKKKGYDFVGCNSNGGNAFFIRKDLKHNLKKLKVEQGFVENKARESRDENGNLSFLSGIDILRVIKDCKVQNVVTDEIFLIKDLFLIK